MSMIPIYVLAAIGALVLLAPVAELVRDWCGELSYRWRKRLARRQPIAFRRWRLAIGYRLMRPHIDAVDLWRKDFYDDSSERGMGAFLTVRKVRQWREKP